MTKKKKKALFLVSPFNLFTSVEWEQLFFTVPHNKTKWLWLAELQLAAKKASVQIEKAEGVKQRVQKREQFRHVISDTEIACTLPSELI